MRVVLVIAALAAACNGGSPSTPSEPADSTDLATYLHALAGTDEASRLRVVRGWRLDRTRWDATIVEPYRALHADYLRAFDAAVPELAARLAVAAPVSVRAHFAGDPRLTLSQVVARWALPTLHDSRIAEVIGAGSLDAVFTHTGGGWRAIVGLDAIVRSRIVALDPACAAPLDAIDPAGGRCVEAAWELADAALRPDRVRFTHACQLATTLCGKRSR